MKFLELASLINALPKHQTVLLLGKPGIGKTSCARYVSHLMTQEKRKTNPEAKPAVCLEIDLSSSLPEDISGLPFPAENCTNFLPPWWVSQLCEPNAYGVVVLDDLPAATQAVQVACRQIALEKRVHQFNFSPNIRVIVTGNRREDKSASTTLPAHFRNSCLMLQVEPDLNEWCTWSVQNSVPTVISAFLRWRNNFFSQVPKQADEQGAFATPRTWAMLGSCLPTAMDQDMVLDVAAGLVGKPIATEFCAFISLYDELPNIKFLFDNPKKALAEPHTSPDRLIAASTALAEYAVNELKKTDIPREVSIMKFMTALAWVTSKNREYCSAALSTFVDHGGVMHDIFNTVMSAKSVDPDIRALLAFMSKALDK